MMPELSSNQTGNDNNTTSKINTSVKASKLDKATRRVSFAPDVTLHSFDFVPTNSSVESPPTNSNYNDSNDGPTTPEADSSVTMDITNPIVVPESISMPNTQSTQTELHEYSDVDDSNEEDQSMEFTMRQERLSPIVLSFNENTNGDGNASAETIEHMELTQPMKSSERNVSPPVKKTTGDIVESGSGQQTSHDVVINQEGSMAVQDVIDANGDEMEFTTVQVPTSSGEGANKSDSDLDNMEMTQPLFTKPIQNNAVHDEGGSKGKGKDKEQSGDHNRTLDKELDTKGHILSSSSTGDNIKSTTMISTSQHEVTKNIPRQGTSDIDRRLSLASRIPKPGNRINQYTHIPRSAIGKSNIPRISTGRKRSVSLIYNMDDDDNNNSTASNRKRQSLRRESTGPEDVTSMERMSPIHLSAFDSDQHNSSQKSSAGTSSAYNLATNKPSVELQPAHMHSLTDFIERAKVGFPANMGDKVNKDATTFSSMKINEETYFKTKQLYDSLYNEFPVIQMDVFIIKELLSIDKQLQESFKDLDKQISSSASQPVILRDYFNSDSSQRERMNAQLQLVRSYSRTEAKKSLDEWYLAQLKNLRSVLIENLSLLTKEHAKVESTLKSCEYIKSRVVDIKEMLKKEVSLLRNAEATTTTTTTVTTTHTPIGTPEGAASEYIETKIKIRSLEKELLKYGKSVKQVNELRQQADTLSAEISHIKQRLKRLGETHKSKLIEPNSLSQRLSLLESVSGIRFISFKGRTLSFKVFGVDEPTFELKLPVEEAGANGYTLNDMLAVSGRLSRDSVLSYFCTQIQLEQSKYDTDSDTTAKSGIDTVSHLIRMARDAALLWKQYKLLEMMFPTRITLSRHGKLGSIPGIDILDYNMSSNEGVKYHISLEAFRKAVTNPVSSIRIDVTAVTGSHRRPSNNLGTHFVKRISRVFPWFTEDRVHLNVSK